MLSTNVSRVKSASSVFLRIRICPIVIAGSILSAFSSSVGPLLDPSLELQKLTILSTSGLKTSEHATKNPRPGVRRDVTVQNVCALIEVHPTETMPVISPTKSIPTAL